MTVKNRVIAPFRYDFVVSSLRPDELKESRRAFENGEISSDELTDVEDKAIETLIEKQKALGLKSITDGEFRRSWWHLDFMWGLGGVEKTEVDHGYKFNAIETRAESARLTGKLSGSNHPFIDHFKFVKQFEDDNTIARQTIPAPAQFLSELYRPENIGSTEAVYPEKSELLKDIAVAYQTFIQELYDAGCRNLQLDDCTWGMIVDENYWKSRSDNVSVSELSREFVDLNNEAIRNRPSDLIVNTHVCRGNYRSQWASSGAYDTVADILFGEENVDGYYLEFDTERAGGFESLKKISGDKLVVL